MCFKQKGKWQKFEPTKEFLEAIKDLTSIKKLHEFLKTYTWVKEVKDYWKTPEEFLLKSGDCEDFSIFALYVLVKIGIKEARLLIHHGFNHDRWGKEKKGHAVCAFPYRGKLAIFSQNKFKSGFESYEDAGHYTFPDGLKYQEVRDNEGKILEKKSKLVGTF